MGSVARNIVFQNNKLPGEIAEALIKSSPDVVSKDDERSVARNIERARQEFVNDDNITFQELDGIDDPERTDSMMSRSHPREFRWDKAG